jgi:hypothetical protein
MILNHVPSQWPQMLQDHQISNNLSSEQKKGIFLGCVAVLLTTALQLCRGTGESSIPGLLSLLGLLLVSLHFPPNSHCLCCFSNTHVGLQEVSFPADTPNRQGILTFINELKHSY